MRQDILMPGIGIVQDDDAVIIKSEQPLTTLASAVVGGGMNTVQTIINRHVHKHYVCDDPVADLQQFAQGRGIAGDFVGLLTAVWMRQARWMTIQHDDICAAIVVTAGVSNASAAGISEPRTVTPNTPGTINIIVLLDANFVPAAMVNAVLTATEAKTGLLHERGIKTRDGYPATGTSTDAMVIAQTGRGAVRPYAGPLTSAGYIIGRGIRTVLSEALDAG